MSPTALKIPTRADCCQRGLLLSACLPARSQHNVSSLLWLLTELIINSLLAADPVPGVSRSDQQTYRSQAKDVSLLLFKQIPHTLFHLKSIKSLSPVYI